MRVINDYGILCEKVLRAVTSEGEHEMKEYSEMGYDNDGLLMGQGSDCSQFRASIQFWNFQPYLIVHYSE
jgi:hypothetical protein